MTDETIGNVPILILGNKIDRPEAVSEEKLRECFGLYGQTTGKVRKRSKRSASWLNKSKARITQRLTPINEEQNLFFFTLCKCFWKQNLDSGFSNMEMWEWKTSHQIKIFYWTPFVVEPLLFIIGWLSENNSQSALSWFMNTCLVSYRTIEGVNL